MMVGVPSPLALALCEDVQACQSMRRHPYHHQDLQEYDSRTCNTSLPERCSNHNDCGCCLQPDVGKQRLEVQLARQLPICVAVADRTCVIASLAKLQRE